MSSKNHLIVDANGRAAHAYLYVNGSLVTALHFDGTLSPVTFTMDPFAGGVIPLSTVAANVQTFRRWLRAIHKEMPLTFAAFTAWSSEVEESGAAMKYKFKLDGPFILNADYSRAAEEFSFQPRPSLVVSAKQFLAFVEALEAMVGLAEDGVAAV